MKSSRHPLKSVIRSAVRCHVSKAREKVTGCAEYMHI